MWNRSVWNHYHLKKLFCVRGIVDSKQIKIKNETTKMFEEKSTKLNRHFINFNSFYFNFSFACCDHRSMDGYRAVFVHCLHHLTIASDCWSTEKCIRIVLFFFILCTAVANEPTNERTKYKNKYEETKLNWRSRRLKLFCYFFASFRKMREHIVMTESICLVGQVGEMGAN